MNFVDIIIILILIYGAYKGWKYGGFSAAFNLVGTILVFVVAYYVKNPVSAYMYENWPFFKFSGVFQGIVSFNILFYEAIAYILCVFVLSIILKVILKLTGIVDKIINLTIVLALPSKIFGLICGLFQYYVYAFIILFVLAQIPFTSKYYNESFLGEKVVGHTPVLSLVTNNLYHSAKEVYEVCVEHEDIDDKSLVDLYSLAVLMKYNIIDVNGVYVLVDNGKLNIDGIDEFLSEWDDSGDKAFEVVGNDLLEQMNEAVTQITGVQQSTETTTTAVEGGF